MEELKKEDPDQHAAIAARVHEFQQEWQRAALDLYKDWHALHFLLCGNAERTDDPLSRVVLGSEMLAPPLDDPEVWYLTPEEVAEASKALARVQFVELTQARSSAAAPDVYQWSAPEPLDYLHKCFVAVRRYYEEAGRDGDGMLMWLS